MPDILDDMWEKLVAVATAREHLQQFRYCIYSATRQFFAVSKTTTKI